MRRIERMRLHEIPRAVRNPKEHYLPGIRTSIHAFSAVIAGELNERTGRLVVGHGRLQVLEAMAAEQVSPAEGILVDDDGTWLVPIVRGCSSRSDADAEAYLVANNRTTEKGGWEEQMLAAVPVKPDETSDYLCGLWWSVVLQRGEWLVDPHLGR
ncbi:hypothetical protein [Nonomuraea sp. NPDC049709]|uniref:hypothetical protein n=1 Tax=Nonomuraea sp. NPDC049709 TaxID=3154736 RepID=UPI00344165A5